MNFLNKIFCGTSGRVCHSDCAVTSVKFDSSVYLLQEEFILK